MKFINYNSMIISYHGMRLLWLLLAELGLSGQRRALEVALLLDPADTPARNMFSLSVAEVGGRGDRDLALVVGGPRVVVWQVRMVVVYTGRHKVVDLSAMLRSLTSSLYILSLSVPMV